MTFSGKYVEFTLGVSSKWTGSYQPVSKNMIREVIYDKLSFTHL